MLAMRDQARLVSTAIQLLTSPESNCLSSSPSIYHKVCSNEAAEPCDPEKPHTQARVPRVAVVLFVHNNSELDSLYFLRGRFLTTMADGLFPQVSELSDLADRPLVGALTSRLQALHTQLQAFVEQVDILGKPPAGGRDPRVEGASPLASPCASPPCSGDGQDGVNAAVEQVTDRKHTPPPHSSSLCLFHLLSVSFF